MTLLLAFVACFILTVTSAKPLKEAPNPPGLIRTTVDRVTDYNYPIESHRLVTSDNYVLTIFRIPYSYYENKTDTPRPVALLLHGIFVSSDSWFLGGPENSLACAMADAGYDVWLGNARGNIYSTENEKISHHSPKFWDFSWHEIATIDLPATIDYILNVTGETALHAVGHSQGTTIQLAMLSELPDYNRKIKTSHFLGPVAFMKHLRCPYRIASPLLGRYPWGNLLPDAKIFPGIQPVQSVLSVLCADKSIFQPICETLIFTIVGFDYKYFNRSVLSEVARAFPAGSSTKQLVHYMQEIESAHFRQFDYGRKWNLVKYGRETPPDYNLKNVVAPIHLYYGDNDFLAAVKDVRQLESLLPNVVESYELPLPEWNHVDFLCSNKVKELINDRIIHAINLYEKTGGKQ